MCRLVPVGKGPASEGAQDPDREVGAECWGDSAASPAARPGLATLSSPGDQELLPPTSHPIPPLLQPQVPPLPFLGFQTPLQCPRPVLGPRPLDPQQGSALLRQGPWGRGIPVCILSSPRHEGLAALPVPRRSRSPGPRPTRRIHLTGLDPRASPCGGSSAPRPLGTPPGLRSSIQATVFGVCRASFGCQALC